MAERTINFVLKSNKGSWEVLDNATYNNNGCNSLSDFPNYLKCWYTPFKTITGCSIEENNILNGAKITAGASVGLGYSLIYFHKNGVPISQRTITNSNAIIFVSISGND